jgi:hypothetical protein
LKTGENLSVFRLTNDFLNIKKNPKIIEGRENFKLNFMNIENVCLLEDIIVKGKISSRILASRPGFDSRAPQKKATLWKCKAKSQIRKNICKLCII